MPGFNDERIAGFEKEIILSVQETLKRCRGYSGSGFSDEGVKELDAIYKLWRIIGIQLATLISIRRLSAGGLPLKGEVSGRSQTMIKEIARARTGLREYQLKSLT